MPRLAWALTLALARCLEPLTIEVEVNDVPQQLVDEWRSDQLSRSA